MGGEQHQYDTEGWPINARESMVSGDVGGRSLLRGPVYVLRAVVTHYGRHENGHYVCFRPRNTEKTPRSALATEKESCLTSEPLAADGSRDFDEPLVSAEKIWWRISDDQITPVDKDAVLRQGGAFMLFYDCLDPTPVLASSLRSKSPCSDIVDPGTLHEASLDDSIAALKLMTVNGSALNSTAAEQVPLPACSDSDLEG